MVSRLPYSSDMAGPISASESIPGDYQYRTYDYLGNPGPWLLVPNNWARYNEARPATRKTKRTSSGWRSPSSWSHSKYVAVAPNVEFSVYKSFTGGISSTIDGNLQVTDGGTWPDGGLLPSLGNLEALAVNQALLKLSNQDVGLAEDFFQRQQMSNMIGDKVGKISDSVNDYKRRHPKDWGKVKKLTRYGRKKLGAIPNSWLEYQYGWVPLLLDVKGVFDVMKHRDSDYKNFRVSVKTRKGSHNQYTSGIRRSTFKLHPGPYVKAVYDDTASVFVRLDYNMVNPALHELQRLGVVNPAAIAWELVPYSFVVDWFLPVGNYLQAWTADLGLAFTGGSISRYQKRKGVSLIATGNPYTKETASFSGGRLENFAMSRTVLSSTPAPRLPSFKNPLSLGHFANAMSLLVSAFK